MSYPDIKEPKETEHLTFVTYLPRFIGIVATPIWVAVLLIWGVENVRFTMGIGLLLTIAALCFLVAFLPQALLDVIRELLGFANKKK